MFERALNSRGVKLRAIHEVLMGASSDELNYIFQTINCAALVEVAWDETMVMLTRPGPRERLAELSVYSRHADGPSLNDSGSVHFHVDDMSRCCFYCLWFVPVESSQPSSREADELQFQSA